MIRTVILGLLRDGVPRHGYELMVAHRARSGEHLNTGNFYRELARLSSEGLVETGVNPPDADARRIPYRITPRGSTLFDEWLISLQVHDDEEISERLLFVDLIPAETRTRLLERWQEELWVRGKILTRAREDALSVGQRNGKVERYDPLPALIARRLAHVTADLEFLRELRQEVDAWEQTRPTPPARSAGSATGKPTKGR